MKRSAEVPPCLGGDAFSEDEELNGFVSESDTKGLSSSSNFLTCSTNLVPGPSLVNISLQGRETPRISIYSTSSYSSN